MRRQIPQSGSRRRFRARVERQTVAPASRIDPQLVGGGSGKRRRRYRSAAAELDEDFLRIPDTAVTSGGFQARSHFETDWLDPNSYLKVKNLSLGAGSTLNS